MSDMKVYFVTPADVGDHVELAEHEIMLVAAGPVEAVRTMCKHLVEMGQLPEGLVIGWTEAGAHSEKYWVVREAPMQEYESGVIPWGHWKFSYFEAIT